MQYFWFFVLYFLAAVPPTDFATSVVPWDDMKVKHTWHDIPVNWETLGHPPAGSAIDLHIVLEPDLENALIDALSEISNPNHPRYRAFLSKGQVDELVRPSPETVELVCAWLAHNGIRSSSISKTHGGTWLTVTDLRVSQASQLLGASYQLYRNMKTNETIIRTIGYSLPAILHSHVQTAMPTTLFSSMEVTVQTPHRRSFGPAPAQMQTMSGKFGTVQARQPPPPLPIVEPGNLRWLYGTDTYVPVAYGPGKNSLAVVGDRLPRQQDLTEFMEAYRKEDANGANVNFNIQNVDGVPLDLGELPSDTSNVAVQYTTVFAYPTPLFVFRIVRTEEMFIALLHFLLRMEPVPRTISISFNFFLERNLPREEAFYMCHLLAQFGARGSSVLVASGNNGVGGRNCRVFEVEFPASCPWVTSVGGTQNLNPEVSNPRSGGGFSRWFARPSYQKGYVLPYVLKLAEEAEDYEGLYNPGGRGYPDISAQALGCRIFLNGFPDVASSTACAVSIAAGMISLLNDYMISTRSPEEERDEAPLGFLNPWLYSDEVRSEKGLNDIKGRSNPGCGTLGFDTKAGGWDPVRPATLVCLSFRRWLIWRFIGHGSRDAKLSKAAVPPQTETISCPYSGSGANTRAKANTIMTTFVAPIFHMCLPSKFVS